MSFGTLLRQWRRTRGFSQLTLATEAGISTRHLSFLETGRACPSREMVFLLAGMLGVPDTDRNAFLVSAGYAPLEVHRPVEPPPLGDARQALEFILGQQEPYPAFVVDPESNILTMNRGARQIFGLFCLRSPGCGPVNATRTIFDPDGLRPYITNWEQLARGIVQSLLHEVAATGNVMLMRLRDDVLAYPGVPAWWRTLDPVAAGPLLPRLHLAKGDLSLAFLSTVTTLAAPKDATLQQLRIRCCFPADAATDRFARDLSAAPECVA